jgi:putative tryptophan/tyrosine transport system substrate-binding protein
MRACAATLWLLFLAFSGAAQSAERQYRIGYLSFPRIPNGQYDAFRQGLKELKYIEGHNVILLTRTAERRRDRLAALASELIASKLDVLVVTTGTAALTAKAASTSVPIVMTGSSDAVAMGIVKSLARPEANVTGLTMISPDLAAKRLELLASLPGMSRVAAVWCPVAPINHEELRRTAAAATSLGIELHPVEYRQGTTQWQALEKNLDSAQPNALFLLDCTYLPVDEILAYAKKRRLATMTPYVGLAAQGAVLAYGPNTDEMARRAALYVDKILRGARPRDLPIEQPSAFELVVNEKAAREAGLAVPNSILARATKVIK